MRACVLLLEFRRVLRLLLLACSDPTGVLSRPVTARVLLRLSLIRLFLLLTLTLTRATERAVVVPLHGAESDAGGLW